MNTVRPDETSSRPARRRARYEAPKLYDEAIKKQCRFQESSSSALVEKYARPALCAAQCVALERLERPASVERTGTTGTH